MEKRNSREYLAEKQFKFVDIHGSCVSRMIFIEGDKTLKGSLDERVKINLYLEKKSRNNATKFANKKIIS